MQKKLLITLALLLTIFSLAHTALPAQAGSPSPSPLASPSPISDQQVTDNLKKRLQDALAPDTTATLSAARAYLGTVKDVIKDTIVMEDKDGKKDLQLQTGTVILRTPGNAPIKSDSIRIDDSIIAIGFPDGDNVLTAKRLIVSTNPIAEPAKSTDMGIIKKITKAALTLTIGDKDQVITLQSSTMLKSTTGAIAQSDLSVGDTVIDTVLNNDDGSFTATIIMRIKTTSIAQ